MRKLVSILCIVLFSSVLFAQKKTSIYGYVSDKEGFPVEGVVINVVDSQIFTITDSLGFYEIEVPPDSRIVLKFSLLGFRQSENGFRIAQGSRYFFNKVLINTSLDLAVVSVRGNRTKNLNSINIDPNLSISLPNASGSFEAILKTLPGVSSNNELSAQYSVRGGNFDENLVYVNDVEIFRPFLIRSGQQEGLSFINSDLISSVRFSSGGFDAKYGDKMSSVLDITYKKPESTKATASTGFTGNSLSFETATKNKKLGFLVGFRNKTNNLFLSTLDTKGDYSPSVIDIQTFLNYSPNRFWDFSTLLNYNSNKYDLIPRDRETTFGDFSQILRLQVFFDGKERDRFENFTGAITTTYKPTSQIQLKLIASKFSTSEFESFDIEGSYRLDEIESGLGNENFGNIRNNLGNGSFYDRARNEFYAQISTIEHKGIINDGIAQLQWGLKYQYESVLDNLNELQFIDSTGFILPNKQPQLIIPIAYRATNTLNSNRLSAFIQNTIDFAQGDISITTGVRTSFWDINNQLTISPRASIAFNPRWQRDIVFRFSGGAYHQPPFYRELRGITGVLNKNVKAQRAIHFVSGVDYNFKMFNSDFKFLGDIYYKKLDNIIPYEVDNVRIRYYENTLAKGYATGIDLRISGELVKDLESTFSLSVQKTAEDIIGDFYDELDKNGNSIRIFPGYLPRPTDQRLNLAMFFQDKLAKNASYKVHLNLLFGSRLPIGPPDFERYKDTLRVPSYRRVDVGFSKDFLFHNKKEIRKIKSFIAYAEVFNLLNINNTISYLWLKDFENRQFAIPNFLTGRQINVKLIAKF